MRIAGRIGLGIALCGLLATGVARADKKKAAAAGAPAMDAQQQKMMQAMKEMMTPDEHHKLLTAHAGTWNTKATMWFPGPDGKPQQSESTGQTQIAAINNGLFIQETFHGSMMNMPFEGHSMAGYDKLRKKFTWVWADSYGSWMIAAMDGTTDASGKVITWTTNEPDPMAGPGATHPARWVLDYSGGADKYTFTSFETRGGKEAKMMEIVYTRAK